MVNQNVEPFPFLGFHSYRSIHVLYDCPADGKPQSCALCKEFNLTKRPNIESFLLAGMPHPVSVTWKYSILSRISYPNVMLPFLSKLDGVCEEVIDNLHEPVFFPYG